MSEIVDHDNDCSTGADPLKELLEMPQIEVKIESNSVITVLTVGERFRDRSTEIIR
jgi:hypothetical protein